MKRILSLLFFISIVCTISAQKKVIPIKDHFADAEYFFVQEEYGEALSEYLQVYKRGYDNNANINYRIGICYLNIAGQKDKSIFFLEKAAINASDRHRESTLNEVHAPIDVYLYLGNAYRINNQLDTAIVQYRHYLELISNKSPQEKEYVEKQIETCNVAKDFMHSPQKVLFNNLGKTINKNNSNYNAVISGNGSTLVYMTKLPFYEAVYMSKRRGSNWGRPQNITSDLMSDGDQLVSGISFDGETLLLAKSDAFNSDIYISKFKNGKWSKSKPIKEINTKFWESHASFSADSKTLYFASNRKDGLGAMDIYEAVIDDKGKWGSVKNLGVGVNTPLNEDKPFVSANGKKLFYSSQGHENIGGYDYFFSELIDTVWTNPQNLQYPLSTTDEDLFYYPIGDGETALVHKIFEDGYGLYDIYEVSFPTEEQIEEAISEQISIDAEEELEQDAADLKADPVVIELTSILFDFDKAVLTSDKKNQISIIVQTLKENSETGLKIIGYADALGENKYNLLLSERRAKEVAKQFIANGIDSERIETIGKGETNFVAPNTTQTGEDNPEGRKYNRRVEFDFIGLNSELYIVKKVSNVPQDMQVPTK